MKTTITENFSKKRSNIKKTFEICFVIAVLATCGFAQKLKDWDTVQEFKKDVAPYNSAISGITEMQDNVNKDYSPIMNEKRVRECLAGGEAFAAIIKQKYAAVENPPWASNWEDKIGTWRKIVEDRDGIAKRYVSAKLGAVLKKKAADLDKARINAPSGHLGFDLPVAFDDREFLHAMVSKEFRPILAAAGVTMPDNSAFAVYDTAIDAIVAEAKKGAGYWKWDATLHDAVAEGKARLWMKTFDPKAEIVKTGMIEAAWNVNKNSLGIPVGRYKRGMVMYRKAGLEQCVVAKFSFEQSYTGGGVYNAMSNTSGFTYLVRLQNCN